MVNTKCRIKFLESDDKLLDVTSPDRPFILYFTARWCGPCRLVSPLYEMLSAKYEKIDFLKIDIDDCEEISSDFNINSVPCFYVYDQNNKFLDKCIGANIEKVETIINKLQFQLPVPQEDKKEKIEKEDEKKIEKILETETSVLYNDSSSLLNYSTFLPSENLDDNLGDLIEDTSPDITVESEHSLNKFFESEPVTDNYSTDNMLEISELNL